jgi:hypothetical protein
MPAPPAHRLVAADTHRVPAPFHAFAVRSEERCHAFDARCPYGCVHVLAPGIVDAAARSRLARAGYARVDIADSFAVDYAATSWDELAALSGVSGLAGAIARALRETRVLGGELAAYERSVATRVDWLASRGAGFHNDVARHWSRSLFWILALDVGEVEFVMPHAGVRIGLSDGDLVVFDQTMAHGLCRPADGGRAVAASFGGGDLGRQLFLTGEMVLDDACWTALGAPWQPVEVHAARGALDLAVAEFDDRSGAVQRVRSLLHGMSRTTCHVEETSMAAQESHGHAP